MLTLEIILSTLLGCFRDSVFGESVDDTAVTEDEDPLVLVLVLGITGGVVVLLVAAVVTSCTGLGFESVMNWTRRGVFCSGPDFAEVFSFCETSSPTGVAAEASSDLDLSEGVIVIKDIRRGVLAAELADFGVFFIQLSRRVGFGVVASLLGVGIAGEDDDSAGV